MFQFTTYHKSLAKKCVSPFRSYPPLLDATPLAPLPESVRKRDGKCYYAMNSDLLGSQRDLSDGIATQCEAFTCDLYPSSRMKPRSVDELRYFLFGQNRKQKNELLPPTSDSLLQHLKKVNYETFVWRKALTAIQYLPQPESNRWVREDSSLKSVYMTKEPAPSSLLELTTCTCQRGCQSNCSCNNTGSSCSEACCRMASSDMCRNPHGVLLDFVSDSE